MFWGAKAEYHLKRGTWHLYTGFSYRPTPTTTQRHRASLTCHDTRCAERRLVYAAYPAYGFSYPACQRMASADVAENS